MEKKGYNLVKALSWYTIGSIVVKSINFVTLRLFTNLIGTEDFGVFGIYQSYLTIFEMIILVGTAHSIKMVKYDKEIDYERYVSSVIYIPIVGTSALVILIQVLSVFTSNIAGLSIGIWRVLIISAGISAIINIFNSKLIIEGKYSIYIVANIISTVINIGVSVGLCYTIYSSQEVYWARIWGGLIAAIVNGILLLCFVKLEKPRAEYIKKAILMGMPLLVHSIATQILVQSDKIIIGQIGSYSEVGIYTAATSLAVIPMTFLSSVEHSWSPWFYDSLSKEKKKEIVDKNTRIIAFFAAGVMLFILASPEIVWLMTSAEYQEAVFVLIPLCIAVFAELIYIIPLNLELYYKKNEAIWIYTMVVVVFNIIVDIICINVFGYLAAAYVTCVSRFLLFYLHYVRAKKVVGIETMKINVTCITILGLIVINFVTVKCIDLWWVRWILIILLVAGVIVALQACRRKLVEVKR